MPIDLGAAYLDAKQQITELVRAATAEERERAVPACPLWTVADVVRHLTGVASDVAGGTMLDVETDVTELWQTDDGVATGATYTDGHVTGRSGQALEQTFADWDAATERLLPMLRGELPTPQSIPFLEYLPVNDCAIHLHDVRGALGRPGGRDSSLISLGLSSFFLSFGLRLSRRGLPPVRIRYDGKERVSGEGEVGATWSGERFELWRALAGRRSNAQIAAMQWEGDATPYIPLVSAYGPHDGDLVE